GGLDGLYNVGADLRPEVLGRDGDLLEMDPAVWRRTFEVNTLGYALAVRAVLPHLLAQGGGSIVCTSSGAAYCGEATRPAYAMSKAGIHTLVRHVASRWGREGIRCNGVAPGLVLFDDGGNPVRDNDTGMQDMSRAAVRHTRVGRGSDLASMVAFLLSDEGEW